MGDAKSWRSQTITVNGKSNMQVYFPDSQPNTFHISNFNNGEIYVGLNEIPSEYSKQFIVKSMCTKVLGSPNGQNSIFIYNPNKHASQIQILSHKEDFDMTLLKDLEIDTKSLEANLKNDNIVRGYMCSLPSGNNHIGGVTVDNLNDTNKYLSEIKNANKNKEILAKLDNLNKLDDISEIKTKIKNDEILLKLNDVNNNLDFSGIVSAINNGLNFTGIIESLNNLKTSIENIHINIPSSDPINPENILNDGDITKINEIKNKIDLLSNTITEIKTIQELNIKNKNEIKNELKKYKVIPTTTMSDISNTQLDIEMDDKSLIKKIVFLNIYRANNLAKTTRPVYICGLKNGLEIFQVQTKLDNDITNMDLPQPVDTIRIENNSGVTIYAQLCIGG